MKKIVFILALIVALTACNGKKTQNDPTLSCYPTSIAYPQIGGTETITVNCNTEWTVTVNGTGFTATPSSGTGDGSVSITADPNPDPSLRSARIQISVKDASLHQTISATQDAKNTLIVNGEQNYAFGPVGGQFQIKVQHNVEVEYAISPDAAAWISCTGTKALQTHTYSFSVAPNPGYDPRTGSVTFRDKAGQLGSYTFTVTQSQTGTVSLSTKTASFLHAGGKLSVEAKHSVPISYTILADFISVAETKALQSDTYTFVVAENKSKEVRSGQVVFATEDGGCKDTLTLSQSAKYYALEATPAHNYDHTGGHFQMTVDHNAGYRLAIDPACEDWIVLSDKTSSPLKEDILREVLTFSVAPNKTYGPRTGRLTVQEASGVYEGTAQITVSQTQEYVLSIDRHLVESPNKGMEFDVTVTASTDFDVTCSEPWVRLTQTAGSKSLDQTTLHFVIDGTFSEQPRTSVITFATRLGNARDSLQVSQAPGDAMTNTLIALYQALDGDHWTAEKQTNWCSYEPIDTWAGVTMENGHITALDLSGAGLRGTLPDALFELQGLRTLDLSHNPQLTGPFHKDLVKCYYLETLLLDHTGLSGPIPADWKDFPYIHRIDLSHTGLSQPLPDAVFGTWKHIEQMHFHHNPDLTGPLPESAANLTTDATDLVLRLDNCNFTGSIPAGWEHLPNIPGTWDLRINGNKLTGEISYALQQHACWEKWNPAVNFIPQQNGNLSLQVLPTAVGATEVSQIKGTTAQLRATLGDTGGSDPTAAGFELNGALINLSPENGVLATSLTRLTPNTVYIVRAFATNKAGTAYGETAEFTTATTPTLGEAAVSELTGTTATVTISIADYGRDPEITSCGFTMNNRNYPAELQEDGSFSHTFTQLRPGSENKVTAYAANSAGSVTSSPVTFRTWDYPDIALPTVSDITATTATVSCTITSDGGAPITAKGFYVNGQKIPITTEGLHMTFHLTGLNANSSQTVSAYVANPIGEVRSEQLSFITAQAAAVSGSIRTQDGSGLTGATVIFEPITADWASVYGDPATKASGIATASARNYSVADLVQRWGEVKRTLETATTQMPHMAYNRSGNRMPRTKAAGNTKGTLYTATTGSGGFYNIQNMEPGYYAVRVVKDGFLTHHTQKHLVIGDNTIDVTGLTSLNGGSFLHWFHEENPTRAFRSPNNRDTLSFSVVWTASDLQAHAGRQLQSITFYPLDTNSVTLFVFTSERLAEEMMNAFQGLDMHSQSQLYTFLNKYGKYMIILENVTAGVTNVVNYSRNLLNNPSLEIPSGETLAIFLSSLQKDRGHGAMMTDGAGPAVHEKGNALGLASNRNLKYLSDLGYSGNWHVGIIVK